MNEFLRKNLIRMLILGILVLAVPITIYLVSQQQDLRSRAASSISNAGSCTIPAPSTAGSHSYTLHKYIPGGTDTIVATSNQISVQVPASSPTQTPQALTLTATPASVSPGQTVRVSWSGVNATYVNWFVGQYGGGAQSALYLGNCTTTAPASVASISSSGFCDFTAPSTPSGIDSSENPVLYYLLFHLTSNFLLDGAITESNRVILITPTPTPTPITFFTPTPTDSPDDCGFGFHMCFRGISECVPFWEAC